MSLLRTSVTSPWSSLLSVLLVAVPLAVAAPPAEAQRSGGQVLHISPDGHDRDTRVCQAPSGSAEAPFASFRVALRCLEPGGTLLVHDGTYTERVAVDVPESARGTAAEPVLVTGAPGEGRPVIRGGLRLAQPDHWVIQDLEITGDGEPYRESGTHPLKILGGTGWVVQRVEVHDVPTTGLVRVEPLPDDLDGEPLSDWTIRDSCFHDTAPSGVGENQDHNLYIWTGEGAGGAGVIEDNVLYGAPNGHNLKLGNKGSSDPGASDDVVVRFNTMSDAVQNIGLYGDTDGVVIERNLLTDVRREKDFYPAVRGLYLTGTGNVARDNAWHDAAQPVLVFTDGSGQYGGSIADQSNVEVDPAFDGRSCATFRPQNPAAQAYGRNASERPDAADLAGLDRVAGGDRVATAVELSRTTHEAADVAVLARADDYPDALASSALAGLVGGPVLLSSHGHVPDAVVAELERLGTDRVVVLGGSAALAPQVDEQLQAAGLDTTRLFGGDRFATATAVADHVRELVQAGAAPPLASDVDEVILVEGANPDPDRGWPDAASAGQLAAAAGAPVLLTTAGTLPRATRDWLAQARPELVTVVGGPTAVSNDVVTEVRRHAGDVRRLAGGTRYETARAVAGDVVERTSSGDPRVRTHVASGRSYPDALTAGPAAAAVGGVLLLSGGDADSNELVYDFLAPVADGELDVVVVGGTVAVPTTFEQGWPYG